MSDESTTPSPRRRRGFLYFLAGAGLMAALLVVPAAIAGGRAMGHFGAPPCFRGDGELTEDVIRDRMGFVVDRALSRVDATDDQVAQVDAVLDGLAPTVFAHRLEGLDLHEELAAALTAEQVDEQELERLRAEFVAHVDEGSALFTAALADTADILTPEQRAELLEIGRRMHGR